jgi:DegV family protein with EDD domain
MNKYGMIIDSTVYLEEEFINKNDIEVVSLNVIDRDKSYKETDIDVDFIFDQQKQGAHFTTSQPAPGEFLETYQRMHEKGYEEIFLVVLSKNLSGTYQSAVLAQSMFDYPGKIHVFDTSLAAYGTEMIALEVMKRINEGKEKEIIWKEVNEIIAHSGQMFTVENLFSLTKGGRLSATQAMIGTVLRIKPIIKVVDGKLKLDGKERTYKKVHQYLIKNVKESLGDRKTLHFYITNTHSKDGAMELRKDLEVAFPHATFHMTDYLGPVFSIHVGKKGYGIAWYSN